VARTLTYFFNASSTNSTALRRRIVRQAEILVELAVIVSMAATAFWPECRRPSARIRAAPPARSRRDIGDVEDKKRRDAFALRHVRDGGVVAMFRRSFPELNAVAKLGASAGRARAAASRPSR